MTMNFNSAYGSGYNMGGMANMQNMYGSSINGTSGNVLSSFKQQYGCHTCFSEGPNFYKYNLPMNELPEKVKKPSLFKNLIQQLFDGI